LGGVPAGGLGVELAAQRVALGQVHRRGGIALAQVDVGHLVLGQGGGAGGADDDEFGMGRTQQTRQQGGA
jgi:hypothetical protein